MKYCRGAGLTEFVLTAGFMAISTIAVIFVLADNERAIFGSAAEALSANEHTTPATHPTGPDLAALQAALGRALNDPSASTRSHLASRMPMPEQVRGMEDWKAVRVGFSTRSPVAARDVSKRDLPQMRSWNPTPEEVMQARGQPAHLGAPAHRTDRFRRVEEVVQSMAGGLENGVLLLAELALRGPDTLRRTDDALDAVTDQYYRVLGDPGHADRIPSVSRRILDAVADGFNQAAHKVAALRQRRSHRGPGYVLATKHEDAEHALDAIQKGDLLPLGRVVTDPAAWSGFAAEALPSLYAMTIGGFPAIFAISSTGVTAQVAGFEKRSDQKVEPLVFGKTVLLTVPLVSFLETIGVRAVRGPGSRLFSWAGESLTEAGQSLVENAVFKATVDRTQEFLEGVLPAAMSGLSGPMVASSFAPGRPKGRTFKQGMVDLGEVLTDGMMKSPRKRQAGYIDLFGKPTAKVSQGMTEAEQQRRFDLARERTLRELEERKAESALYPAEQAVRQRMREPNVGPRPVLERSPGDPLMQATLDVLQRKQMQTMLDEADAGLAVEKRHRQGLESFVRSQQQNPTSAKNAIDGNEALAARASQGKGTAEDPYVITIRETGTRGETAVRIMNTTDHVVVRVDAQGFSEAVQVVNSQNVTIDALNIRRVRGQQGSSLLGQTGLQGAPGTAVAVYGSSAVVVTGNICDVKGGMGTAGMWSIFGDATPAGNGGKARVVFADHSEVLVSKVQTDGVRGGMAGGAAPTVFGKGSDGAHAGDSAFVESVESIVVASGNRATGIGGFKALSGPGGPTGPMGTGGRGARGADAGFVDATGGSVDVQGNHAEAKGSLAAPAAPGGYGHDGPDGARGGDAYFVRCRGCTSANVENNAGRLRAGLGSFAGFTIPAPAFLGGARPGSNGPPGSIAVVNSEGSHVSEAGNNFDTRDAVELPELPIHPFQ